MPAVSELVICREGPLHRRVYTAAEWAAHPREHYADTGEFSPPLGDIFTYWGKSDPALKAQSARVYEHDGTAPPRRSDTRTACTFLGCNRRPTHRITGETDAVGWLGCDKHWPAMVGSFGLGQRIDYTVDVTRLPTRHTAR